VGSKRLVEYKRKGKSKEPECRNIFKLPVRARIAYQSGAYDIRSLRLLVAAAAEVLERRAAGMAEGGEEGKRMLGMRGGARRNQSWYESGARRKLRCVVQNNPLDVGSFQPL
jgi:hypothetical protein